LSISYSVPSSAFAWVSTSSGPSTTTIVGAAAADPVVGWRSDFLDSVQLQLRGGIYGRHGVHIQIELGCGGPGGVDLVLAVTTESGVRVAASSLHFDTLPLPITLHTTCSMICRLER
jgi:hypothetical protein